tara:strand:+ start:2290 stop:3639 length:1350 start_codon:yes stop_codon:yes gene_type:complete
MATIDYTTYDPNDIQTASGGLFGVFDSIMSEYNNPQWFKKIIFDPFASITGGWQDPYAKIGYRTASGLEEQTKGRIHEFNPSDWESMDHIVDVGMENIDDRLDLLLTQTEESKQLAEEQFAHERDKTITAAENQMESTLEAQDASKFQLRQKALQTISQIDSMIAHGGLTSGSYDAKRKIALDTVQSDLEKANFSKAMSVKEYNQAKIMAEEEYSSNITSSNMAKDAQYQTALLSGEQEKENLGLGAVQDKISIYEEWKADQVASASTIITGGEHLYTTLEQREEEYEAGGEEYNWLADQYHSFEGDNWETWKAENSELYQDMLSNPYDYDLDYVHTYQSRTGSGGPGGDQQGERAQSQDTTSTRILSEAEKDHLIMNYVFFHNAGEGSVAEAQSAMWEEHFGDEFDGDPMSNLAIGYDDDQSYYDFFENFAFTSQLGYDDTFLHSTWI